MQKKTRIIITIAMVALLFGACVVAMIVDINNAYDIKNNSNIFETINDLDFLDANDPVGIEDKNEIENLNEKLVKVTYENTDFNIYAYEFDSKEQAWIYAKKISGNNYSTLYETFGETSFHYTKTVNILGIYQKRQTMIVSENKVLLIASSCNSQKYSEFLGYIFGELPVKVEYSH